MSYLVGPAVLLNDGRPAVSGMGVDRILPSRAVQGSWQSPHWEHWLGGTDIGGGGGTDSMQ